jgi:hypothetical protein
VISASAIVSGVQFPRLVAGLHQPAADDAPVASDLAVIRGICAEVLVEQHAIHAGRGRLAHGSRHRGRRMRRAGAHHHAEEPEADRRNRMSVEPSHHDVLLIFRP